MQGSAGRAANEHVKQALAGQKFLARQVGGYSDDGQNQLYCSLRRLGFGVWGWGLGMSFAMTLLFRFQAANYDLACMTFLWSTVCLTAVICSVAGYFMGSGMWVANEELRRRGV